MTVPTTPQQALATTHQPQEAAQDLTITGLAGRADIERIETSVTIPADYQYAIGRRVKDENGNWHTENKVGITADGYDYLNRVIGVSFFLPDTVHDEKDDLHHNPIHRKDYIYLRLGAVWYTPLGQLVMATEDVEVDFNLTWMDARINSRSAAVVTDPVSGMPTFDAFGNPAVKCSAEDELKALKTLSQLRTFGPRYAQTVARVRLLKMATGIRSLPLPAPQNFRVKVVGFRDKMSAQQRVERAGGDMAGLYGRPEDIKPLSADEMASVGAAVDSDVEQIDREAVAAHVAQERENHQPRASTSWSADELPPEVR